MKEDWKIKQDVEEELEWTPGVVATHIGVEVANGIITLSGHPGSYAEKLAAEDAARRVSGVRAVVVEMEVRLPHHEARNDADIAGAVDTLLRWTVGLPAGAVSVQVEKGHVTLRGDVDWAYRKRSIKDALPSRGRRSEARCPRGHLHTDTDDREQRPQEPPGDWRETRWPSRV
ncbi:MULTISPECIES: BON domain-containing protein [unclassified Caballeronia]|uniref:BON domain-containing protein n=1 Tax=unclassified Caballeronia TaxID=2646786 RepID=UPI002540DC17|nr:MULTISPECIES: BON domain-containing protein [unclassified Caballeronia]